MNLPIEKNLPADNLRLLITKMARKFLCGKLDEKKCRELLEHAQRIWPMSPLREEGTGMDEIGWVIVRYINSELLYWNGNGVRDIDFEPNNLKAIRFARQVDAAIVLSWMLQGGGKVEEHMWCPNAELEAHKPPCTDPANCDGSSCKRDPACDD